MKRKIALILVSLFASCLSGCGKADILNQYDMDGIAYIAYTDIDTVCESQELSRLGQISYLQWKNICCYRM